MKTSAAVFITYLILGFIEFVTGLRVLLKLLGASSKSTFVVWIYGISSPFIVPFKGMFPDYNLTPKVVIEFSSIAAVVVYAAVGILISQIIEKAMTHAPKKEETHPEAKPKL